MRYFTSSLSKKDTGLYYFLFRWDSLERWRQVWEGGSTAWVMSLTALAAFVSQRYAAACFVMPLSFVFRGNNCTPQSFREESHITDATDPLMLWTSFSTFPSRKFEWQTSGDNGKQWSVIDSTTEIRPTVLIWDDSSSLSSGDVVETKLWYLFSYSVELSDAYIIQVWLQSPQMSDFCWHQKRGGISIHVRIQNSLQVKLTALS